MTSIRETERALYQDVWQVPDYAKHSPGEQRVQMFCEMTTVDDGLMHRWGPDGVKLTVLDAGSGSGKGALALASAGFDVRMCDLTPDGLAPEARALPFEPACLWQDLRSQLGYIDGGAFDYVYCVDVLEHLPTQFTMLAVANMLAVTRWSLFVGVSLMEDNFGTWVGRPLHQTVQTFQWWKDSLAEVGHVVEARDLLDSAAFLVRRRAATTVENALKRAAERLRTRLVELQPWST